MLKASAHEITPAEGLNIEQPEYGSEAAPRSSFHSEFRNSIGFSPPRSSSVLLVIDENGYLTPLLTAEDLLRLCKVAWRGAGLR